MCREMRLHPTRLSLISTGHRAVGAPLRPCTAPQSCRGWEAPLELPPSIPQQLHSIQGGLGSPQETPPPLWAPFQGSATLTAQQFLLTFRWNSLGCSLCPLLLILALSTTKQSPAPSPAPSLQISISWRCSRPHHPTALCWALSSSSHPSGPRQPHTVQHSQCAPPGRAEHHTAASALSHNSTHASVPITAQPASTSRQHPSRELLHSHVSWM